jgi:CarD family transcriptional regulator
MYNVNDVVIYAPQCVCRVDDISEHDFSGSPVTYYVLKPVNDSKNIFYVPTENSSLTDRMRHILSKNDIDSLISLMPDEANIWIDDEHLRKETYSEILRKGDRKDLIKLIKTLYSRKKNNGYRKLHAADERFLKEAENMLYDEFAYVLDIPRDQVVTYIKQHI